MREELGHTQASLAGLWGMGAHGGRTIRRWESGNATVPPIVAYCLRMMVDGGE